MSVITQVHRLKYRRTKIIATLGPSSASPQIIAKLIEAGVNVFRLNMSHGNQETHASTFQHIREIAGQLVKPVGILVDLAGPKIRTGKFEGGYIDLRNNEEVSITIRDVLGKAGLIPSQYAGLVHDVVEGSKILLDDGTLELRVISVAGDEVHCKVIHGGVLKNHKGMNFPGCSISVAALTDKDRKDVRFALNLGADFIALSFVGKASDVEDLRQEIVAQQGQAKIIAKIETVQSLVHAEAILDAADGIMVARGDLGAELPPEEVPIAQDQLIGLAREKMKPVIVATQMLESMIKLPRPTRAEVTDVSYAVQAGVDAIMLSAETASGDFPIEVVNTMDRIARQTESHLWKKGLWGMPVAKYKALPTMHEGISRAVSFVSKDLMAHGIVVVSKSQKSSLAVCAARPACPIVAITSNENDYCSFSLFWGVLPILNKDALAVNPIDVARVTATDLGLGKTGDIILLVKGFNEDPKLDTPSITAFAL